MFCFVFRVYAVDICSFLVGVLNQTNGDKEETRGPPHMCLYGTSFADLLRAHSTHSALECPNSASIQQSKN